MEESRIYDIKWIKTARYPCRECGIFASLDDYLNDVPCRSCNGTRQKRQTARQTPLFPVRIRHPAGTLRTYDHWTMEKIEQKRKEGFIVEIERYEGIYLQ